MQTVRRCKINGTGVAKLWAERESIGPNVIEFLESKYSNTKTGRIKNAAKKKDYTHNWGHLMKKETAALKKLDWDRNDPMVRKERKTITGYESTKDLSSAELLKWIAYLEDKADKPPD
jgi:hypothetical protein